MRIFKITSSAEYWMEEQFQNCSFFKPNFGYPNWKNLLIFQQFGKLAIWKIPKIYNLENSKNLQFRKFEKSTISEIPKNFNSENSKNFEFGKFQTLLIWKIPKKSQFRKLQKLSI